jgi:cellulose synthase (UDP-forming)
MHEYCLPFIAAMTDSPDSTFLARPVVVEPAVRTEATQRRHRLFSHAAWEHRALQLAALLSGSLLLVTVISVPLDLWEQIVFGLLCGVTALLLNRFPGRLVTLVLTFVSLTVSSRYLYWRVTETLHMESWVDIFFGSGLIAAEVYAWLVLVLGFFQTVWPLERRPAPMNLPFKEWPTVDIFIPSYNEPLKVVKPTVLAAMALDWPADKLRIHILDDGRREEFRDFAAEVGVNWIIRSDNRHAKAGNINAALSNTDGEFVAIFDCDHIPTRSFLQMTMGWFIKDPKLAMLQTPHHFFSPDPFERNLGTFGRVPNEGELFYGLVQDGNDLWNATFFCGSCAVLRRGPLLEVGGIAVETVTEDAHTALKLHRRGYNTAYISVPQAAGLATESLSAHVGQRIRWARGMAQIFRLDCPLLGRGLTLAQRLCYANAMLHFFYGLPRIVFLTAPLAYLFFEAHVIQASALMIAAMAVPHLFHANLVNSRTQGRFRHSFWAEVYEAVLAWYILRPTLFALINPRFGKFNVTAKGGHVERDYFDWGIAKPYVAMLALNMLGLVVGVARLFWLNTNEVDTVVMNLVWTVYNLIILGATISAASETRQVRDAHRVRLGIPARLRTPDGEVWMASTQDLSEGGMRLRLPHGVMLPADQPIELSLYRGDEAADFPARVVFRDGRHHGVKFDPMTLEQQKALVGATFSRADAWIFRDHGRPTDRPFTALREITVLGLRGCASVLGLRRAGRSRAGQQSGPAAKN